MTLEHVTEESVGHIEDHNEIADHVNGSTNVHGIVDTAQLATLADLAAAGGGTMSSQNADAVNITGGVIAGVTDIAVADGGTGSSTAAGARTNLGLGTIATQAANAVAITGGTISGITDLALADGGTGASDATGARTSLGLGTIATQAANSVAITGGTISGATGPVYTATTSTSGFGFVVDEDTMTSDSATKVPTQQSTKAYVDALPTLTTSDTAKVPISTASGVTTLNVGNLVAVSAGGVTYVRAASDGTPVNNSTVYVNDATMIIAVVANAVYDMRATIYHDASIAADCNIGWVLPTGCSGEYYCHRTLDTAAASDLKVSLSTLTAWSSGTSCGGVNASPNASVVPAVFSGTLIVGSTAGNLQLKFAQHAAVAEDTIRKAGSIIILRRIA